MQLITNRNSFRHSKGQNAVHAANYRSCQVKGIFDNRSSSMQIRAVVKRYFYVAPHDIELTNEKQEIDCTQFVNDQGGAVKRFRDFRKSGYFNLYVNGMMQGGSFYRISKTRLILNATGQSIYQGTPIIIESIGFFLRKRK